MISISPIQEKILRGLAKYKYLTTDQLQRLTGVKHKQQVYENLRALRDRGFVDSIIYGAVTRVGTTSKLNFLTYKGAKVVSDLPDIGGIRYPKSTTTMFKNDFYHRIHTIDLMIGFDQWIDTTAHLPTFFDTYFDTIGSQKSDVLKSTSKTRVEVSEQVSVTPDAIFGFEEGAGAQRLFVLEVTNGRDTGRTTRQIKNNLVAIYKGKVSEKYGIKKTPLLLVAFEHEAHRDGVRKAVMQEGFTTTFQGLERYLFFAMQKQASQDWAGSWETIEGQTAAIF